MLSERKADRLLEQQTAVAQKVFGSVPIQEAWPVHLIIRSIKDLNGGNMPDHGLILGCLNSLTDCGLIKRVDKDVYQRAPVRGKTSTVKLKAVPTVAEVPQAPVVLELPDPVEEPVSEYNDEQLNEIITQGIDAMTTVTPIKPTVEQPQAVAAPVPAKPKFDALGAMGMMAEQLVNMSNTIKGMAHQLEELALAVEQEREATAKKAAEVAQLKQILRSLQLADD